MLLWAVIATIAAQRRAVAATDDRAAARASCSHGRRDARVLGHRSPVLLEAATHVSRRRDVRPPLTARSRLK